MARMFVDSKPRQTNVILESFVVIQVRKMQLTPFLIGCRSSYMEYRRKNIEDQYSLLM